MSHSKTPLSLRANFTSTSRGTTAIVACACAVVPAVAIAADAAKSTTLSPVVVEAAAESTGAANPYANPQAPYKVEAMSSAKYSRPIAQTPKTITVIGKEAIADSGASDLSEVMRAQPGITIGTGEGGNAFGDRYIIRGFEARNDVFVDGLRDPGVTSRDIFAVEQIEVSKGPSSSFAGRGTTGGAINNVTKKPTDENFTKVETTFGTDSKQRYSVDNNLKVNDELAVRTNLLYSDREVPGRDDVDEQHQGAAVAVEWTPSDRLKINADYYYQATDDTPDGGVPWDSLTAAPVKGSHYYGQNGRDYWEASSNIATLGVEYDINDNVTIENKSRYGVTSNEYFVTIPGLTTATAARGDAIGLATPGVYVASSSQNRNQENTYLGNQTNVMFDTEIAEQKHSFVFGTEISREKSENLPFSDALRSPNAGDPLNPNNNAWLEQGGTFAPNTANFAELEIDTLSIYAMDTWTVNADWELFAGLRYDTFDYAINSGPTAYVGGTAGKIENDEQFINGHFGVVYSPWEDGNVYASYSTSSNPTGEQLDAFTNCAYGGVCQDGTTGSFAKPEQNTNLELGTKWELMDDNLLLTASLFQITKENVISSAGGRGTPITFNQVGEMRVRGFEVGVSGNITDKLSGQFGLVLLDTEITKSDTASEIGQPFPNTAETSANIQLKYQATPQWAVGGTVTYTGEIEGGTPNSATTGNTIKSNTRLDLMTEYTVTDDATLRLNVLNVTDREYYDALYRSGSPFTYVGEGRSAFVTLAYTF